MESWEDIPPPLPELTPFLLRPKRKCHPGLSAQGVSVLSVKGYIHDMENGRINLHLDSCANVTLISEEFYKGLINKPSLKTGSWMNLFQLTDKSCQIQGYMKISLFMTTEQDAQVETEAKAYVVPGMTVPILLGEDYQLNYELTVKRDVEEGTMVSFGSTPFTVQAVPVGPTDDYKALRASVHDVIHFMRHKTHQRNRAKHEQVRKRSTAFNASVRADRDYQLRSNSCTNIRVEGNFEDEGEWIVEKGLLPESRVTFFAMPNVLISSRFPVIPVMNPSDQPHMIRKGEIIDFISRAESYFNTPRSEEELREMGALTAQIRGLVDLKMEEEQRKSFSSEVKEDSEEELGPKMAAIPDFSTIPSSKFREVIDVRSIPEHLKEQVWAMLERHEKAFGFDDCLGNHPAKARIRVKEGTEPILVPMYMVSPAKKEVMDRQIDHWFEQGVIEPSKSPWSAPVVIVYHNGKP